VTVALVHVLDGSDSLLLGLVRKHRSEGAVTDGTDVRDLSAVLLVDDEAAPLVTLETNVVETKTRGVGAAADSDKNNVGVKLCLLAKSWYLGPWFNLQSPPFRPLKPQR
jgi:hypothetical protein